MKFPFSFTARLLQEWLKKRSSTTVHTIQISKLRWAVIFPEEALLFGSKGSGESKRDGQLSLIGGLCQTRREEDIPAIALLREIRQKLGIESGLTEPDHTKLVWRKNFSTEGGSPVQFHSDGWVQIGYALRYREDEPIHKVKLAFGITLVTHRFEVTITRDQPDEVEYPALANLVVATEAEAEALRQIGFAGSLAQLLWRTWR